MTDAIRPWCAWAQYPGKAPFLGGTVTLSAEAMAHEVDAALRAHFLTRLPDGFQILEPVAGSLFFHGENDD